MNPGRQSAKRNDCQEIHEEAKKAFANYIDAGENLNPGFLYKGDGSGAPWYLALTASDFPSGLPDCAGGALLCNPKLSGITHCFASVGPAA